MIKINNQRPVDDEERAEEKSTTVINAMGGLKINKEKTDDDREEDII